MTGDEHLRLERVSSSRSAVFRDAFALYEATIPRAEQKTRAQIVQGLKKPDIYVWAFTRGGVVVGVSILHASQAQNMLLLEYLAISPSVQGKGLGAELFAKSVDASRSGPDALVLVEVDSERDQVDDAERAIRMRRKQFYRRLGCAEIAGLDYILPLETFGPAPRMNLLVHDAGGRVIAGARLRAMLEAIYVKVYGQRAQDPRIDQMLGGPDRDWLLE